MPEIAEFARRSEWHSQRSQSPRCLFCGGGTPWFDRGNEPGCGCRPALAAREGKLLFQLIYRNGRLVVTKCSPELWRPLIDTGILVGSLGAVIGKELPEDSRRAMYAASAAWKAERQPEQTEAQPANPSQIESPVAAKPQETESPPESVLPRPGVREAKRQRILAMILLVPHRLCRPAGHETGGR